MKSIKSELEDLTDRANATAEMCTPEIRAYLGNFDLNARTKFASSYKRIDEIIRGLEREVDAEVAHCEKEADEWSAMARDDLSHGRTSSSQFSDETAQKYKKGDGSPEKSSTNIDSDAVPFTRCERVFKRALHKNVIENQSPSSFNC